MGSVDSALTAPPPPEPAVLPRLVPRWQTLGRAAGLWLGQRWGYVVAAAAALAIAGWYAVRVMAWGPRLGFPLDDAYIYMTYAKQIARGRPFTYFDGGGFSAGATSMLWPAVLAPLWAVGFRGHWFCYAVFGVCAALLAATAALAFHLGRRTLGTVGGLVAALLIVSSGPLTWAYLSGMEVPLAGTLILACVALLAHEGAGPRPSRGLLVLLAATALARPEAGLLVALVVGARALAMAWRRRWLAALRWLSPLSAPLAAALVTRIFAGHFAPNTAVSKSHFYLPGFDWTYYQTAVWKQTKGLCGELFWNGDKTPLFAARLALALWLIGAVRLVIWGVRERRLTAVAMLLGAPAAIFAAVLAASGQWHFQNYRYIAAALPALLAVIGLAVSPGRRLPGLGTPRYIVLGLGVVAGAFGVWAARAGLPVLRENLRLYAQGARDNNAQVVAIGHWIDANLPPNAHIAIHDVGAIGYYSNRRLTDVIGLITNHQAEVCNQGPGARFEAFERMPADQRPTHFAYYPGWLVTGARDFFGRSLFRPPVPPPLGSGPIPRILGGGATPMEVFEANWTPLGSGAQPLELAPGWSVVDEVDVADIVSEHAHGYRADQGRRNFDDPTNKWSNYFSTTQPVGGTPRLVADGGRTIRGPRGERFTIHAHAGPVRLVVRFGGPASLPGSGIPAKPAPLVVSEGERVVGQLTPPPPAPTFSDVVVNLPAGDATRTLTVTCRQPYRTYHYFVLQQ